MKRIVKNIGFVIIALNAHFSNAQEQDIFSANMFPVGIYNTYSDFKNNKPTKNNTSRTKNTGETPDFCVTGR